MKLRQKIRRLNNLTAEKRCRCNGSVRTTDKFSGRKKRKKLKTR